MNDAPPTAIVELRRWDQWVLWRIDAREGKLTKIPLCPRSPGNRASSTDPKTWGPYEATLKPIERGRADGVGFVFTPGDEYFGIDLDHCVVDGVVHPKAMEIVQRMNTYTEFSPSGDGLHIIGRGRVNGDRNRTKKTPWGHDFEVYDQARFFTMTGRQLFGTPATIEARQDELDAICAEMFPVVKVNGNGKVEDFRGAPLTPPTTLDDVALEEKIRSSKQGPKFAELFDRGAADGQESEADLALCNILAFWIGPDETRIDAWFRRSALMREKWDAKRGDTTYGGYTINRALDGRTEFYGQKKSTQQHVGDDRAAADAEARSKLGEFFGLDGRTVTQVTAGGRDTKARHDIHISDGSVLTLDPLAAYTSGAKLGAEIAIQLGTMPRLSETVVTEVDGKRKERKVSRVLEVLTLIHQLREIREELTLDQRAIDFGIGCLQTFPAHPWTPTDQTSRWVSLLSMKDVDPAGTESPGFFVLVDGDGRRYLRTGWFHTFVRSQCSPGVAEDVCRRMIGLGWKRPGSDGRIKATNPNGSERLSWNFWVIEAGWEDA